MTDQHRIYLDLDGPVFPIGPAPENDPSIYRHNRRYWWRPDVLRRLGSLSAEIVLSSSWGEEFIDASVSLQQAKDLIAPSRALSDAAIYRTSKARVIRTDIVASPARFAWIEDHPMHWRQRKLLDELHAEDESYLRITPDEHEGLLHTHVDQVEEFFATTPNR